MVKGVVALSLLIAALTSHVAAATPQISTVAPEFPTAHSLASAHFITDKDVEPDMAGGLAVPLGRPADVASSAYAYRADRSPEQNPPESWILLIQYAGLPYDEPPDMNAPAVKQALCGLLWEEVRPIRRVELSWNGAAARIPPPDQLTLTYFDTSDQNAHTWWNPLTKTTAGPPEVSADGRTCVFAIPRDTWGIVVSVGGDKEASQSYSVPTIRALVPETWKRLDLEIEWGFDPGYCRLGLQRTDRTV